jgi:hypothetical protein
LKLPRKVFVRHFVRDLKYVYKKVTHEKAFQNVHEKNKKQKNSMFDFAGKF